MFIEKLEPVAARAAIAAGRQVYEWKTKDPHQLPIVGPAYDDHPGRNRAKREGRYAETLEQAQAVAHTMNTEIVQAFFLSE
ncbi:MAG: hypothetical protein EPN33_04095 [Acidobacteria bacterium]|nr:MAG: hypothetical protein EPN33_04095 [Acidobacteriota bacterium]